VKKKTRIAPFSLPFSGAQQKKSPPLPHTLQATSLLLSKAVCQNIVRNSQTAK
jgi:hypothetical protein